MEDALPDELTQVEMTGPDVEEAVQRGLAELGLARSDVKIEVLDQGGRGLLGLMSRPARVRLTRAEAAPALSAPVVVEGPPPMGVATADALPHPESGADEALRVSRLTLEAMLSKMGLTAVVTAAWGEASELGEEQPLLLDVRGEDLESLIGRRGETLAALQYITHLIVSRRLGRRALLVIDVEGYRERRVQQLTRLALRTADQVVKHGRPLPLEPMLANERRIVHLALRDHEHVYTESSGVGSQRRVTVYPKSDS